MKFSFRVGDRIRLRHYPQFGFATIISIDSEEQKALVQWDEDKIAPGTHRMRSTEQLWKIVTTIEPIEIMKEIL